MQVIDVIDNFLPEYQFKQLSNVILSNYFSWYFNDCIVLPDENGYDDKAYQFVHRIFNGADGGIPSDYYSLCNILQQRLGVKKLH